MVCRHKRRAGLPNRRFTREARLPRRFIRSTEILRLSDSEEDELKIMPAVSPGLMKSRQCQSIIVGETARRKDGQVRYATALAIVRCLTQKVRVVVTVEAERAVLVLSGEDGRRVDNLSIGPFFSDLL